MIAYVERREKKLGMALWIRDSNGRREITEPTLRLHCPELFEKTLQQATGEMRGYIEKLEGRLCHMVDQRIERPVAQLRSAVTETNHCIKKLSQATEKSFQHYESRISRLEMSIVPTETD